jgi:hypothetical protein
MCANIALISQMYFVEKYKNVKVKQSLYRPGRAQRVPGS